MKTLKGLRLEAGLSTHDLAFKAGIREVTLLRMEAGKPVQGLKFAAVCQALGVSMNDVEGVVIASGRHNQQ